MCGIAGAYAWPGGDRATEVMVRVLAHRGPDGEGRYDAMAGDVPVNLGHLRLSIQDLSTAANQPFVKDGLALVYNGELYNPHELRSELLAKGVTFRTTGDTEVLLEAWRAWGAAALPRLRGMYAFAIFDERTGVLSVARDPLGIKPLFLMRRQGGLLFSSELKGIVAALGGRVDIDPVGMVAALTYRWVPDQRCMIKGVEKLQPGMWLEMRPDGSSRLERFYDVVQVAREASQRPPADLAWVIEDSVKRHLIADVPVSTFLSGGLDSSLVTVIAKRESADVDAYTIGFRAEDAKLEAMPDDLKYARMIAAREGIKLHEIEIAPQIVDLWPKMVHSLDEPIGEGAAINTALICRAARERGVKVLLSGMGADELFGGYRKHYAMLLGMKYQRLPKAVRGSVDAVAGRLPVVVGNRGLRSVRWGKKFLAFAELPESAAFMRSTGLLEQEEAHRIFTPGLLPAFDELVAEHDSIYADGDDLDAVNRMCLADTRLFLTGLNLAFTDRASMAESSEVRVPFVDIDVVQAAFTFPGSAKIEGRERKAVLKKVATRWLPEDVVYRPKGAFSAPLRAWVRRDLTTMIDDLLPAGRLVGDGWLQRGEIERMVKEDRSGHEDYSHHIWQLLTMELWYRQLREGGATASACLPDSTVTAS
jgi:asparagine synthase (glutamine-hydrolysing)